MAPPIAAALPRVGNRWRRTLALTALIIALIPIVAAMAFPPLRRIAPGLYGLSCRSHVCAEDLAALPAAENLYREAVVFVGRKVIPLAEPRGGRHAGGAAGHARCRDARGRLSLEGCLCAGGGRCAQRAQSPRAAAAHGAHHHRLELVVAGVGRDHVGAVIACDALEKVPSRDAPLGLRRRGGRSGRW